MNCQDNIIGEHFGRWVVLSFSHKDKKGHSYYHCKCECGTERDVELYSLKNGKTKSCGKCNIKNKFLVSPGEKIGRWTVLKFLNKDKKI